MTSIRLIFAIACQKNFELRQIDVKGAYLNGTLEEDIYMRQPKGFIKRGEEHFVCKLHKSLYGLKQLGRVWHNTLKDHMISIGFVRGNSDSSIFFKYNQNSIIVIVGWYVDNGLIAVDTKTTMEEVVKDICRTFTIQDLGEPIHLLGIKIDHNRNSGVIKLSQPTYIDKIAS